jgi:stage V sporulation protein D (sporulation-specific penicillin-binding protein)
MDPKTGDIISMVNYPDYDPNNFTQVNAMEKVNYAKYQNPFFDLFGIPTFVVDTASGTLFTNIDGQRLHLREASIDELSNFAIPKYKYKNKYGPGIYSNDIVTALYEPGSVFKAVTVAIGLDTGEIEPTDTYFDKGFVELDYGGGQK